jgi:leader peptidase (prepilin peptidase)/N-methyltransferase
MAPLLSVVAVLGLAVGSFLNVVIYRVPRGESVVRPGSHCPNCQTAIRPWHNVPVFSWLVLRGRCATCKTRISVRYPLVELGTAALFVAVTARLGLSAALPAYLYLAAITIALALIDVDVQRLPNAIVYPSYLVGAGLLVVAGGVDGDWAAVGRGLLGMAALFVFYLGLSFTYKGRGMGLGDVKLAGVLGLYLGWLGWSSLLVGVFAGFLLGGLIGGTLLALRRAGLRTQFPFGPSMLAGAFIAVFAGGPIGAWYLSLLLPTV